MYTRNSSSHLETKILGILLKINDFLIEYVCKIFYIQMKGKRNLPKSRNLSRN